MGITTWRGQAVSLQTKITLILSATRWSCSSWILRQLEPLPVLTVNFLCPVTSRFLLHLALRHLQYLHQTGCVISTLKQYSAINSGYGLKSNQTKAAKSTISIYGCAVEGGDYLVSLCKNDKLQYLQQRRATPGRPRCWWSPLSPSCRTLPAVLAASDLVRWRLLIKYWAPYTVNKLFGKQLLDAIEQNVWARSRFAIKAV